MDRNDDHDFERLVEKRTRDLEKALRELEKLHNVMRKMNSTLDLDEVLDLLIGELESMFSFEGIAILLLDDTRERLSTRKLRIPNMSKDRLEAIRRENEAIPVRIPEGGGVARAVLSKKDYYFNYIDPADLVEGPNKEAVIKTGLVSVFIVPLLVDDEAIGVMLMSNYSRPLGFDLTDLETIRRFVAQISQAIKNSRLYESLQETSRRLDQRGSELAEANAQLARQQQILLDQKTLLEEQKLKLEELSTTDELTGIRNRRYFFKHASVELERSRRKDSNLFILMIDLDDFKEVNDTHGHDCGDSVLRHCAEIIGSVVRSGDILARYGGEEFIVASVDNDELGAARLAERVRRKIKEHECRYGETSIVMSASVGIGCSEASEGHSSSLDEVIKRADVALYHAKAHGKDRCVAWQEIR